MADFDTDEIPESEKTPVTIITGFLGSGKTTLVNYILKEQNSWKICVVENEFGEVAIDNELVEENLAAKEDIITLDNGCVCCSVRGDLVRTFALLVGRRKDFDAIIIETTGLADPSPIVFTFNNNAILQDNFRIDSVVCLIDAKHINIHLDDVKPEGDINEAERQVAFADRILLNKLDLVSEEELDDVEDRIKSMNSFAKIIHTRHSRAPLDQVLGLNSFSLEQLVEQDPTFMDQEEDGHDHAHGGEGHVHDEHCGHHVHDEHCGHHSDGHGDDGHEHGHDHHDENCNHGHDCDGHAHTDNHEQAKKKKKQHNLSLVSSVGFTILGLLDVTAFNTFMSGLLQEKAKDLYRTKGVLGFADQGDLKFVFQGVHEQINFGPSEKTWGDKEVRESKMVFIGKNLDYDYLKEKLLSCTVDPSAAKVTMHKRA